MIIFVLVRGGGQKKEARGDWGEEEIWGAGEVGGGWFLLLWGEAWWGWYCVA